MFMVFDKLPCGYRSTTISRYARLTPILVPHATPRHTPQAIHHASSLESRQSRAENIPFSANTLLALYTSLGIALFPLSSTSFTDASFQHLSSNVAGGGESGVMIVAVEAVRTMRLSEDLHVGRSRGSRGDKEDTGTYLYLRAEARIDVVPFSAGTTMSIPQCLSQTLQTYILKRLYSPSVSSNRYVTGLAI